MRYYPRSAVAEPALRIETPLDVRLVETGFSPGHPLGLFARAHKESGGIASFVGQVRGGDAHALELSHYEPITLPAMRDLAETTAKRFALDGLLAWHRVGVMTPGQAIVLVAAAAPHRRAAFEATDSMMDHLKSAAWFWKRERREDGWHWIEPRGQDRADLARWTD